jgi:arsenate reductase
MPKTDKTPPPILLLAYAGCDTCRRAQRWLIAHGIAVTVRPIVEQPPTAAELAVWIPASGVGVRKWLNTSGQSYRALGKPAVDAASDATLRQWLTSDGKLVKRPLLVTGDRVLLGFHEETYQALLAPLSPA